LVKNWTIYLFTINTLAAIALLISIYTEVNSGEAISGKTMAIILVPSWLFIYFKILTSPEILYGLPILNKKLLKYSSPVIEDKKTREPVKENWLIETNSQMNNPDLKLQSKIKSNINSYIKEIDILSSKALIFRVPKASVSSLANKLNVPTSHLVYLFKYHSSISFSEYRMHSRIQDSIALIENDYLKTNTLESLAYKVGFSSYNPFYLAFKKITDLSPQDYMRTIKKKSDS
jgi:AraC-like DNA-binding protein